VQRAPQIGKPLPGSPAAVQRPDDHLERLHVLPDLSIVLQREPRGIGRFAASQLQLGEVAEMTELAPLEITTEVVLAPLDPGLRMRKFLKQVGVTSQRAIEDLVRDQGLNGGDLRVRMVLTAEGQDLEHVVEGKIDLE
jgi:hypothetical protein